MKSGMTLLELVVAMAIMMIVIGIVFSIYAYAFPKMAFFDKNWPGQTAARLSVFTVTKYLHNASTAIASDAMSNESGNYIFLDKNTDTLYKIVKSTDSNSTEKITITKNIQSVSFTVVTKAPSVWVVLSVRGTTEKETKGATFTTKVLLNNAVSNSTSPSSGTVLFFKLK